MNKYNTCNYVFCHTFFLPPEKGYRENKLL